MSDQDLDFHRCANRVWKLVETFGRTNGVDSESMQAIIRWILTGWTVTNALLAADDADEQYMDAMLREEANQFALHLYLAATQNHSTRVSEDLRQKLIELTALLARTGAP